MNLPSTTIIGRVLAVLTHIAAIEPKQRTDTERYWAGICETALLRLYSKVPHHLKALDAKIEVTLGRLVEASEPGPAESAEPKKEE